VPTAQVLLTTVSVAPCGSEFGIALALDAFALLVLRGAGMPTWAAWAPGLSRRCCPQRCLSASTGAAHTPAVLSTSG
jgi:hypothetical protein